MKKVKLYIVNTNGSRTEVEPNTDFCIKENGDIIRKQAEREGNNRNGNC